jgi:hypothetical protein
MNDTAVSEAVGFILIMGIMLTGIGLITLYGYPMLIQEQQNTNVKNMERNMIVLQNDLKSLTYKNVPYKETTLQVAGGTLTVDPGGLTSSFTVNVDGYPPLPPFPLGEIHYESQDGATTISLENGAVHTRMWSSSTGSAMLSEPRWFYDPTTKTFVMTIIRIDSADYLAQTGIGTVRMRLAGDPDQEEYPIASGNDVEITYQSDIKNNYNTAWRNYFDTLGMTYISGDGSYSKYNLDNLNPPPEKFVIKTYHVTVLSL